MNKCLLFQPPRTYDSRAASETRPAVSVVVPTCGRPDLLSRCLAALIAQHYDARYEIIVVDDRPSRDTHDIVDSWSEQAQPGRASLKYIASRGPHGPA
ncbi:MAG: glycosyltransferase, partial [Burkholderiaceae bacterium]|nr:glycosyltransferase [Burkholderiaceae bacterium]